MDTVKANRVTMFKTVDAYLDQNNTVWNGMALFVDASQAFKTKIAAIDTAAQKQEAPTGATADKASARETLEDVLFLMCQALSVLGHSGNDNDLLALTNLSASDIHRLTETELSNRAATVLVEANARKPALATVQVTQANIDEFDQAIQNFNAAKAAPRTRTADRVAQTQSLSELIREVNEILRNQIDPLVNLFRRTNTDFVAGYKAARVIVDRAASHAAGKSAGTAPTSTPTGNK